MIYTKQNAAGSPASDFDEIGDPFAPRGERLHDRPNAAAVAAEIDAMNHRFDDLHIYDTPIHGPANAAMPDVRGELEREMRQRYVGGPTVHADGSVNPMEDGHLMPTTYENAVRFSGGEVRQAVTAQSEWGDGLVRDYRDMYGPELANDTAGLQAAATTVMETLRRSGYDPVRYIQASDENRRQFLFDVNIAHETGRWGRDDNDAGRTGGIFSSGAAAPQREPDTMNDTQFHRELQRRKGIID